MITLRKIYTCLFVLFTANTFAQQAPNADFLFPIDIAPSVSGSFAELRSNHFHSGIDLSTNGKIGLPIKSMEQGTVSRIKVSSVGYGNAIYIKHPNGYTTVYGHLRNYSSRIDSIITAEQYKIESFGIDYFPEHDIAIAKGEIIGYSGNSGSSGGPHLHYEIRETKTEEPVNPFFFQNIIKDDVRPKLMTIRIYPLTENSTINGTNAAKNYPVVFYDGQYHLKSKPTIYASGKIGVAIEMIDYMSGSWKKCGVYKLNMKVDNIDYYGWELDQFSFAESRYINSHIDYAYKARYGKRFERCYRQPGNLLRVYNKTKYDGIISMDSTRRVHIQASDAANNLSDLEFKLIKAKNKVSNTHQAEKKLSYLKAHTLQVEGAQCYIPQGALYQDEKIVISKRGDETGKVIYEIGNKNIPLHKYASISITLPDNIKTYGTKACLASVNGSQRKYYAGGKIENDSIKLHTKSFGNYTFAIDTIAPTIRALQNIRGRVFNNNAKFLFKISDNFSGINSYNAYLNNKWTLLEYDAKTAKLSCPLSKARVAKGGKYDFKLVIKDNCGNEKVLESHFSMSR